jgi:hypothetical protein
MLVRQMSFLNEAKQVGCTNLDPLRITADSSFDQPLLNQFTDAEARELFCAHDAWEK